ncbi:MAG TPA: homoserine O-succinyltransferase [Parvularcula sp.]|nr:homoserine O-succinyltransferase [Parvularcula sp.]
MSRNGGLRGRNPMGLCDFPDARREEAEAETMSAALDARFFDAAPPGALGAGSCVDVSVILPADFRLQSGEKLSKPELRLRLFGPDDGRASVVSGGISSGREVADGAGAKGWWRDVVFPGGPIDTAATRVIGFDFLPNAGETARTITTVDQARALAFALDAAGVSMLSCVSGASYGGMVALAFAEQFPERLEKLCVISAADRPHAAATALRGIQRRIVEFGLKAGDAQAGLSLARQLAMTTYRTPEEFEARFPHRPGVAAGDPYAVCDYLIARGDAYQMSPERYVTLSDSIDRHAVDPRRIRAPALFVAATSDRLVPAADIMRLARAAPNARYAEFSSLYGHDAFLKEPVAVAALLRSFIEKD